MDILETLCPKPQRVERRDGFMSCPDSIVIYLENEVPVIHAIAERLQRRLTDIGLTVRLTATDAALDPPFITLRLDPDDAVYIQGYRLVVDGQGIRVTGADAAGLFYGVATLIQLCAAATGSQSPGLPRVRIVDWPDFPNRGVMLDVSRDKVPTMETLYALIDRLADWKINQVQLYMEHPFAYRGHEVVWSGASPYTGEDIMALDAYCRERFVELVPNQNSFGHMTRWLVHEPYNALAECPEGCELWPGHPGEPFSLCPTDPGSLALLEDLYNQLLPHFSSPIFNAGLDETFDLGKGRSAEICEAEGTERVYLGFLKRVHHLVTERGYTMQFWGDIILHAPELVSELPDDAIAMEWGYEATHPFDANCQYFAEAGLAFYVCPGTSSWNTIGGRTDNALDNIARAAVNGKETGAVGVLNTDWGDNGHMQPLPVSYLGFLAGAVMSWNSAVDLNEIDIPSLLDLYAFEDVAGVMGQIAFDLGNVYKIPGIETPNASPLFLLLIHPERQMPEDVDVESLASGLRDARQALSEIKVRIPDARMIRADADWIRDEFTWAMDLLDFAARLGLARLEHDPPVPTSALSDEVGATLAADLEALIERYREVWLRRNRPGGLDDSVTRLEQVVHRLRGAV
jgi:hypothetical protein